jgi:hypothetical protein
MNFCEKANQFFQCLNRKDSTCILECFSDICVLYDWNNIITTRPKIYEYYTNYFSSTVALVVHIDSMASVRNVVFAQLSVLMDNQQGYNQVYVFNFDEQGKINRLMRYKQ